MKWALILSSLLSVILADEAKILTAPLAYGGYPYAGAAPAKVEVKTIEAPALPAVTYAAAPSITYATAPAPAITYAAAAVAPVVAAPYAAGSQFHAQDEFGNLNYGYANINS